MDKLKSETQSDVTLAFEMLLLRKKIEACDSEETSYISSLQFERKELLDLYFHKKFGSNVTFLG